jgi:WD40 repeat protein
LTGLREVPFSFCEANPLQILRLEAERQTRQALAKSLTAQALGFYETYPQQSLLLAVEGGRIVSSKNEREPISLRSFLFKAFRDVSGVGLGGHQAAVRSLSFSSNGEWLASVSVDKRTLLWNISAPEGEISSIKLPGHGNEIRSVTFSKEAETLFTGVLDSTFFAWDLSSSDPSQHPSVLLDIKKASW